MITLRRAGMFAAGAAFAALSIFAPGQQAAAQGLGSAYDPSKAGDKTLTVWWLGNQEVPGIEDWMAEAVAAYQKQYPNITVNVVLQPVDTYNTLQKTACKGGSGPDVWYNWGGTWSLELAWIGCTVANEDALAPEDLTSVPAIQGTKWGGKTWVYPFEHRIFPVVYSKEIFEKVGLDPEQPPKTWADFLAACEKIKAAGITPIVLGLKDGFGGEITGVGLQSQVYTIPEFIQMVIDGDFTSDKWKSWIKKLVELKPYFNDDTNSTLLADGLARFQEGEAAMVFASPGYLQTSKTMTEDGKKVGVMKVPSFAENKDLQDILTVDTPGFQVTQFATDKALAGNFMAFLHAKDELNALYSEIGTLPIDQRWDASTVVRDTDAQLAKWGREKVTYYSANYYPIDLDVNANFVIFQGILGGDMTVDQAADTYKEVITKWRSVHAPDIENYKAWLQDYSK
jgi:ABC-type glycerol-3-phosphate transport system substrate-binding protein